MRKRKILVSLTMSLAVFLVGMVVVSSYARSAERPKTWPKDIHFGCGPSPTVSTYIIAAYWCDLLQKEYGMRGTPIASTSEENCLGAGTKKMAVGYGVAPTVVEALNGEVAFTKVGPQPIRLMSMTADLHWNFFALKESGIKTLSDLRGKTFSADYKGASYHLPIMKELLAAYGLSEKDVTIGAYARAPEAFNNVVNRTADACSNMGPYGMAFIKEFCMTQNAIFLSLSEEAIKKVTDKRSWLSPSVIPAGMYKGIDKNMPTIKTKMTWVVHKDSPEDFVYQILKYCYHPDYRAGFEKVHFVCRKEHLLERAVVDPVIPYHAGAVKFYKDMGVWTSELDKWQKDFLKKLGEKK